jgi:very-short-patch-repair endonuclease
MGSNSSISNWPTYEPPYDSPIEDIFAWEIVKYLHEDAEFHPQFEVKTQCGPYWIDFVCISGGRTIGFECDGQGYHDEARDEWRDALIMETRRVNAIYRIRGRNIFHQIGRAFYLVSGYEKNLFSDRGSTNLKILGEADLLSVSRVENMASLEYRWYPEMLEHLLDDQDSYNQAWLPMFLSIAVRTDRFFQGCEPSWSHKARFARHHQGKSLAEIMRLGKSV